MGLQATQKMVHCMSGKFVPPLLEESIADMRQILFVDDQPLESICYEVKLGPVGGHMSILHSHPRAWDDKRYGSVSQMGTL